jgi:hypothetical protein
MSYIYILYKEATFLPTNIRLGWKCMTVSSALSYYSVALNYLGKKFGPLLVEAPTLTNGKMTKTFAYNIVKLVLTLVIVRWAPPMEAQALLTGWQEQTHQLTIAWILLPQ